LERQACLLPRRLSLWADLILCLLLLAACGSATITPPPPVFLRAAGSTSVEPLLAELAVAYSDRQPNVTIDIQGGGSQLGYRLVSSGQVDLGLVSWSPGELAGELRLVPVAHDALAIIVHPQNQSTGLSLAELRDIFSGRRLDWQEVGSPAGPIQVVSREDGSGSRAAFETLVMANQTVTPTAIVLPNSRAVVEYVAQHPKAVAYVSLAFVDDRVFAVPVEGIAPTLDSLAAGSYSLIRDLALVMPRRSSPQVNGLVEFALSPAGQAVVQTKWGRVE
jgi:phosphate transport system substrate-binding protein